MKNQNTTKTVKAPVTIGATVCYRTKAKSFATAVVKNIVDSEFGKMAVLTFEKDGQTVEFQKLLKSVWVYTGKKAEAPAEPELAVNDEVFYAAKSGKPAKATVTAIEDGIATIKCFFGGKHIQRELGKLFRTSEACSAAIAAA